MAATVSFQFLCPSAPFPFSSLPGRGAARLPCQKLLRWAMASGRVPDRRWMVAWRDRGVLAQGSEQPRARAREQKQTA